MKYVILNASKLNGLQFHVWKSKYEFTVKAEIKKHGNFKKKWVEKNESKIFSNSRKNDGWCIYIMILGWTETIHLLVVRNIDKSRNIPKIIFRHNHSFSHYSISPWFLFFLFNLKYHLFLQVDDFGMNVHVLYLIKWCMKQSCITC